MNYTGNVDYKSIKDKQFMTADSENVSEIVKKLNEQNIQFSVRYDDVKMTVTFNKSDFSKVNEILKSAAAAQGKSSRHTQTQGNVMEKIPGAEEIERMHRNIEQNKEEMKRFEADLKKLLSGDKKIASSPLLVGKTPASLAICGADGNLDMTITKKVIEKCMRPETRDEDGRLIGKTGHGLRDSEILSAMMELHNPTMILNGKHDNSLVVLTEIKDTKNRNIVVAIDLSQNDGFRCVNNIRSLYGRDNLSMFLEQNMKDGKIIAVNKEKANRLLHSIGKSYPKENTTISFDNSIAYTTANVKYPNQENHVNLDKMSLENHSADKTTEQLVQLQKMILEMQQEQQNINQQLNEQKAEKPVQNADTAIDAKPAVNNGEVKPEHASLLPIIGTKVIKHEQRIEELKDQRAAHEEKITDYQGRAERLTEKAERLNATNQMLAELLARRKMPAAVVNSIRALIRANEVQAANIRNNKLPKLENKIGGRMTKIESIDKRINLRQCKINRYASLNSVIKSFAHADRKEFSAFLDELHNNTIKMLNAKIDVKTDNIIRLTELYKQSPVTAVAAEVPMSLTRQKISRQKLIQKRNKLMGVVIPYVSQPEQVQENIMKQAEGIITNAAKQESVTPAEVAENVALSSVSLLPENLIESPEKKILASFSYEAFNDHDQMWDDQITYYAIDGRFFSENESGYNGSKEVEELTAEQVKDGILTLMTTGVNVKTEDKQLMRKLREDPLKAVEELVESGADTTGSITDNELPEKNEPTKSKDSSEMFAEIAKLMNMSVSQIESRPKDIQNLLVSIYKDNFESSPQELQEKLSAVMNPDVRTEEAIDKRLETRNGLVSAELTNGETVHFRLNEQITAQQALETLANAERPFIALREIGKQVDEMQAAGFEQSDRCGYSITANFNDKSAKIYEINGGNGGISEENRTDSNVSFTHLDLNDFRNNPLKTTEELVEGNANMIDGIINNEPPKKDEPKQEQPKEEKPQGFTFSLAQLKRNAKRISQQKQEQPKDERKPPDHGGL